MTTVEILRAARERLAEPGGWAYKADGVWRSAAGGDCAANAISKYHVESFPAQYALCRVLGDTRTNPDVTMIYDWNDAPGRKLAEVLFLFDEAIANEEAREQEFTAEPLADLELAER